MVPVATASRAVRMISLLSVSPENVRLPFVWKSEATMLLCATSVTATSLTVATGSVIVNFMDDNTLSSMTELADGDTAIVALLIGRIVHDEAPLDRTVKYFEASNVAESDEVTVTDPIETAWPWLDVPTAVMARLELGCDVDVHATVLLDSFKKRRRGRECDAHRDEGVEHSPGEGELQRNRATERHHHWAWARQTHSHVYLSRAHGNVLVAT
eukprot:PhM_4_TR13948/c2_g1_i1/m.88092